ncbi:MAG: DUF1329 domain-containing protein [Deltaproteobacteria bacterium]|nr:DUF1329 domain-containing protein [Deltaproteobacteria bacterium]
MQLCCWMKTACAVMVAGAVSLTAAGWVTADVQPGDTITKENMDKAADLLTPAMKWYVQNGMPMKIAPYKKIQWPRLYREATEKYAGQVRISPDGREIYNYVAGAPFPNIDTNDPLVAFKIMWNQEQKPAYTDNVGTEWIMRLVNSKGEMERQYGSGFWRRMMWTGRLYADPKPVVPHNPAMRYTEQFGPLFEPNDLKGAGTLSNRYMAMESPDDSYIYLPELRRVRRISVSNRSDAFWGSDYDLDSLWGFNSKVSYWTFRLLGEKEVLAPMHSGKYGDHSIWCAPADGKGGMRAFMPCDIPWEKRPVWVIEGLPTAYSQYAFSKRIMYIDKDTLAPATMEAYDQGGELWKVFFNLFNYTKKPYDGYPTRPLPGGKYDYEDEWAFDPHGMMADLQTAHGCPWDAPSGLTKPSDWVNEWYFNEAVPINTEQAFSINYLIQSAR